jgi:cytoplasmic iron level regulating protein YaaA (DUF328/UPF0246 family)
MKLILSPAKSIELKDIPGNIPASQILFTKESQLLVNKLKKKKVKDLEALMHISKDLAELNVQRYKNWHQPTEVSEDVKQAIFAFNGEAYKGFDVRSLKPDQLLIAQEKVRILSGLYGVLKPLDLIYPYRLEMGTSLEVSPKQKNLYQFWGKKIAEALNQEMTEGEVLINVASTEYFKAIDKKTFKGKVITPVFKDLKNGEYKVIMMFAKHARGAMARFIVENKIEDPEQIKLFSDGGYHFDVNQSTDSEWVFTR